MIDPKIDPMEGEPMWLSCPPVDDIPVRVLDGQVYTKRFGGDWVHLEGEFKHKFAHRLYPRDPSHRTCFDGQY